jgi:alpha-aminoadipate carrier protein LysW
MESDEIMADILCPDCTAEIDVPEDSMVGEIVSCPDCGLDLEIVDNKEGNVELQRISIEKEDWGE